MTKWPGPIIKLYLGQFTPAANASVEEGRPHEVRQTCRANFYGIWMLLRQEAKPEAKEEAARLLKSAANECYKSALEWRAAVAELKALESSTPTAPADAPPKEEPKEQPKDK